MWLIYIILNSLVLHTSYTTCMGKQTQKRKLLIPVLSPFLLFFVVFFLFIVWFFKTINTKTIIYRLYSNIYNKASSFNWKTSMNTHLLICCIEERWIETERKSGLPESRPPQLSFLTSEHLLSKGYPSPLLQDYWGQRNQHT